jgi:hypothetical protein
VSLFNTWAEDEIPLLDQPLMKLVGGVNAIRGADRPDLLVFRGFLHFLVQQDLNRAFDVVTVFSFAIFNKISWKAHDS